MHRSGCSRPRCPPGASPPCSQDRREPRGPIVPSGTFRDIWGHCIPGRAGSSRRCRGFTAGTMVGRAASTAKGASVSSSVPCCIGGSYCGERNPFWDIPRMVILCPHSIPKLAEGAMGSALTDEYEVLLEWLVSARREARLTQRELADRIKRPQSFVSKYERGERRLDVVELVKVCDALGADPCKAISHVKARLPARLRLDELPDQVS